MSSTENFLNYSEIANYDKWPVNLQQLDAFPTKNMGEQSQRVTSEVYFYVDVSP